MAASSGTSAPEHALQPPYTFGVPWPELNDGVSYTDVIRLTENAKTLIDFYSTKYKSSAPLQGWIHRIRNGQVSIDGYVVTDPQTVLSVGAKIVYLRLPWNEACAPFMLQVLYEDDDLWKHDNAVTVQGGENIKGEWIVRVTQLFENLVAINKPSGLQVLPGGLFQQRTVLTQLQWKVWKQVTYSSSSRAIKEPHPVPVHRLGRGTSGILLCAKTKLAKTTLATYFAEGTSLVGDNRIVEGEVGRVQKISKLYRALVTGILEQDEMLVEKPIGVMNYPGVAKGLYVASSTGKPALSKIQVLYRDNCKDQTLVQVQIHSGRPHQIRIHLAFIGHPLVGDSLYQIGGQPCLHEAKIIDDSFAEDGGYRKPERPVPGDSGYHLHAHRLVLRHPSTNKLIEITAPLPSMLEM